MNAFLDMLQHPIMEAIGAALLHFIWQGALIAGLLALALFLTKGRPVNLRYTLCALAMLLMFMLPVATAWQLYVTLDATAQNVTPSMEAVVVDKQTKHAPASGSAILPDDNPDLTSVASGSSESSTVSRRIRNEWLAWRQVMVVIWLTGLVFFSVRLITGFLTLFRLKQSAATISNDYAIECLDTLRSRMNIKVAVQLRKSVEIYQPVLIGWIKPVILVPASLIGGLSHAHLEAILAHELAHVRRHDYLVLLGQSVMETLFFYHPAVWWVSHRMNVEREYCCDEVAGQVSNKRVYATALANIEAHRVQLALGMGDGRLIDRINRLIARKHSPQKNRASWLQLFLLMIGFSLLFVACRQIQDSRPADEIFFEANELARAGEYHAAEELASIAAEKGSLCAMQLLAEMTDPNLTVFSPRKLVTLPAVRWSGQSERKARHWAAVYVDALEDTAQAGNSNAMVLLSHLYHEGYSNHDWARYVAKDSLAARRWIIAAAEIGNPEAMLAYPNAIGLENSEERLAYFKAAFEAGESRALGLWHYEVVKDVFENPRSFFGILNEAFELDPGSAKREYKKTLARIEQMASEGDSISISWMEIAAEFNIYERYDQAIEKPPVEFPKRPFCPDTKDWRYPS